MYFLKSALLLFFLSMLNGCTVLGFATDMVLNSALEDAVCGDREPCRLRSSDEGNELFFTQIGLKQDAKVVNTLIKEVEKSNAESQKTEMPTLPQKPTIVACKKVVEGKQQCFPEDYYKEMYKPVK